MSQTTGRTKTLRTSRNAIKIINQAALRYQSVCVPLASGSRRHHASADARPTNVRTRRLFPVELELIGPTSCSRSRSRDQPSQGVLQSCR